MARNQNTSESIVTLDDEPTTGTAAVDGTQTASVEIGSGDSQLSGKKVKLEIFEQEGDLGKEAVFVQINGFAYQIPRNQVVVIPVEVYEVISSAKYAVDEKRGNTIVPREVKRFGYSFLGEVA